MAAEKVDSWWTSISTSTVTSSSSREAERRRRRVAMTTICRAAMPDDVWSQWNSQRGTSPFFICSARVLCRPSVRLCAVGQCPTGQPSRVAGGWHRVVCMTVASAAVATNLQSSSLSSSSQQLAMHSSGKWPSQLPPRIITYDVNICLEMWSLITARRQTLVSLPRRLQYYSSLFIIVVRSSDSESEATIIFCGYFCFFSPHFLRRRKTDIPETFPHDVA